MNALPPEKETGPALSLRISLTDRCMLRCAYCQPEGTRGVRGLGGLDRQDACPTSVCGPPACSAEEVVRFVRILRSRYAVEKARLTGGEPLLRADIADIVHGIAQEGVPDVALTTNAQRLAAAAPQLRGAGLRRVNVSLDSLRPDVFARLARGGSLAAALRGIDAALECGLLPVKVNMVVLRGVNDGEVADMLRFGLERGVAVRFLEVMPIGPAAGRFREWFVPSDEVRSQLEAEFRIGAAPLAPPGTSEDYFAEDAQGRKGVVGFIPSCSRPFCGGCRKLRLATDGRLIGCLASGEGPLVGGMLRRDSPAARRALLGIVEKTLAGKRPRGEFATPRLMAAVGG